MQLSGLCRELEECIGRFGDVPMSIGAVTGAWRSMAGLEEAVVEGERYAAFAAGGKSYRDGGLRAQGLLEQARDFLERHGDLQAGVSQDGILHTFVQLDVDDDIDDDGYPVSVAILQAYVVKPRFSAVR